MENVFNNIDLSEFLNSESPVLKADEVKTSKPEPKVVEKNNEEKIEDTGGHPLLNMTPEELAEYEPEEEDDSKAGKTKTETKDTPVNKDKHSSESQLSSLAQHLYEAGVLSSIEEEELNDVDDESFVKLIEKQIKTNELKDLTEDQKEYLEALRNGVPQHVYSERKANAETYKAVKDDQIENPNSVVLRKELLIRKCIAEGLNQDAAVKYADRTIKLGEDIEEAKEARDFLIEFEKNKLAKSIQEAKDAKAREEKEESDKLLSMRSKVNQTSSVIEGINFNSQTKDKIFDSITKPVKMVNNQPVNELMAKYLEDDEFKIKLHYLFHITGGLKDFSKINKEATTKSVKTLSDKLKTSSELKTGSAPSKSTGTTTQSILAGIRDLTTKKD